MSRIVFDIGGSHLRLARVDGDTLSAALKIDTPPLPEEALETIATLIERIAPGESVEVIFGAVAGVIGENGVVLASPNLPRWEGFPLGKNLEERFHSRASIVNDAAAEGVGEAHFGAGKGFPIVAYLTLGTGVGGARIVDGTVDRYAQGFEPGHQIIEAARGMTLESLIGGAALTRTHGAPPETLPRDEWEKLTKFLAVGIWNTIVHWSPDVVVLGGSLMNETTAFRLAEVTRAVESCRRVVPTLPPIKVAALGDQAGLGGARVLLGD